MSTEHLKNLGPKILGDHRDQRAAVRAAGFADDAAAAAWARGVLADSPGASEPQQLRAIREARPDLTLRTATYILQQTRTH